jgi:hypothetical protein
MNVGWGTPRDDSLPHQIRFHQSDEPGGLGVYVTCVCLTRQRLPVKERMLGGRNIFGEADSRWLYNSHLVEELVETTTTSVDDGLVHHGCCGCPKCNGGFAGPARHG